MVIGNSWLSKCPPAENECPHSSSFLSVLACQSQLSEIHLPNCFSPSLTWKGSSSKSFHLPFESKATGAHWESLMECYPFRRVLYAFLINNSSLRLCGETALIWVVPGNNSQHESLWWLFINMCWYSLCVCVCMVLIESNLFCRYLLTFDAVWMWLSIRFVIAGDCLFCFFLFWLMAPNPMPFGLHTQKGTVLRTIFHIVSWYLAAMK